MNSEITLFLCFILIPCHQLFLLVPYMIIYPSFSLLFEIPLLSPAPFLTSKYQLHFHSDVELCFFESIYSHLLHIFTILCLYLRQRQNAHFSSSLSWSNENMSISNIISSTTSVKSCWYLDTSAL